MDAITAFLYLNPNMARGNFFYKRIGEKIVSTRIKRKMSQEELALLSDVDRTFLARIEGGKANFSVKVLNKIAKVLKTRLVNLVRDA